MKWKRKRKEKKENKNKEIILKILNKFLYK